MPEGFGFKVWISTEDGVDLPEYGIETDKKKKVVTCWIPSEAGKKFKVMGSKLAHYKKDTAGRVYVDGTDVGGGFIFKSGSNQSSLAVIDGVTTSPTTVRKFVFSSLTTSDDSSLLGVSHAKNIGSISVELQEIKAGKTVPTVGCTIKEQSTIHERSKKALVHKVGFAPEEKLKKKTTMRAVECIQIFGTIVFKYRPLDVLQANGIAPAPKTHTLSQRNESDKKKANSTKKSSSKDGEKVGPAKKKDSGSKRKLDDMKKDDDDEHSEEAKEKERERLRARIRKLEREQELEELRERLREIEGN